ncbi:filamentous hemagglutinin family protein [Pseudomonas entomophila]|uniref:filamentous haemagglutinin family protein n=1 Tax=Pseudomonas entomophila TaxID=312306 RepID=UPI0024071087|nr:filamentous haemagglutinin family protein [Pseudomonas entomophila]MDF9618069.1 filamentous hemagglutinin family protein [Pseudomonas entomophila]
MSRGMPQPASPAPAVQPRGKSCGEPLLLKPLAQAIALCLLAGSAQAGQAFSSAWFAAKGASTAPAATSGGTGGLPQPGSPPPLAQQQRINQQFQHSVSNLNNTVAAIAAQQAAQANGRTLAQVQPQVVPNGLGEGGLKVDENPLTQGWLNAKAPQQAQSGGKTQVRIEQTADKAILNWETFNVGRDTTVTFDQQAQWAVLNRVNDPNARPSQIHGQIEAAGTVMLVNRNGVVFNGASQVNVRNLVAAAAQVSDEQFSQRGLYVDNSGSQATFVNAGGKVVVERGAQIHTREPATSTAGGGYVLLLGSEVRNDGQIASPKGQATLAAGDDFYIRRGRGTEANQFSTTRGNEVASSRRGDSGAGTVVNGGLIQAAGGDITLTGHQVRQEGVALASTAVDRRGSIHLLNAASDSTGSVTFGQGSVTAVLLDDSSALDSQREASRALLNGSTGNLATGRFDNLSTVVDRPEQSRVEAVSGGTVHFEEGSLTLATGGQVAVSAGRRSLVEDGAGIDVAGALGVKVAMQSNLIKINVQGNEQRDAAGNRDKGGLINSDVWVDVRELVHVAAGVNGYASERWYTAGGLLEVGGYLGTRNHSVGEWMAQGGTLTFTGQDLVTRAGARFNLSGGTLAVQDGVIRQSWLRGEDGHLYELSRAPGDLLYSGVYQGFEQTSARWNQTRLFHNPLIAPGQRFEQGYTVGRDAGSLVVATQAALLDGQLIGETWRDQRQQQAPVAGLDGYQQAHTAQARGAQLVIGQQVPLYQASSKELVHGLYPVLRQVLLRDGARGDSAGVALLAPLDEARRGRLVLDTGLLNGFALGGLSVAASERVEVADALRLADGGQLALHGSQVQVDANLVARGGTLRLGNVLGQLNAGAVIDQALATPAGLRAQVVVAAGVRLDASGVRSEHGEASERAWRNGGNLVLRGTGDLLLGQGSLLDVSGGVVRGDGNRLLGGSGGNLTLQTAYFDSTGSSDGNSRLQLGGELRGYGSTGAGTLDIRGGHVQIGGPRGDTTGVYLPEDFFALGFAQYNVRASASLRVVEGSQVKVTRPVEQLDAGDAVVDQPKLWLPPLLQEDALKGRLGQRGGASLSLAAGDVLLSQAKREAAVLVVGRGAAIRVDPLQSIALRSTAQLTLDGSLQAPGGAVSLLQERAPLAASGISEAPHQRSIHLGGEALIDVGGRAYTALDSQGRRYGRVDAGGSIVMGGNLEQTKGVSEAADLFVVLEQGSRLRADGAQATLDIRGQGPLQVASAGGSISLASNNGLRLDGEFSAASGGQGAAAGSLAVALDTGLYLNRALLDGLVAPRELVLEQHAGPAAQGPLRYGQGRLSIERVQAGGFGSLALLSDGVLAFAGDVDLGLAQDLRLYAGSLVLAEGAASDTRVRLHAPYVRLAGSTHQSSDLATRPTVKGGQSQRASEALLQVEANLLDLRDEVTLGAHGRLNLAGGQSLQFDRRGFALGRLRSEGDIRLLGSSNPAVDRGRFTSNADLELLAAQIYPVTGAFGAVAAGLDATLRIGRVGTATPAVPQSVFGRVRLEGGTVEQGGVVRAPLGEVALGIEARSAAGDVQRLRLLPGSITSVSAAGLVMPYGGTLDGLSYLYGGKAVSLIGAAGDTSHGIMLGARQVEVQAGALVDLSGGGELTGAGFVSGRGGSTDARYHPLVQLDGNGRLLLPSLASNPVYAIVPGLAQDYAPLAGASGAADPAIGQRITLDHGVPGLAAGTYTLLPASYALLPGAYRVELNGLAQAGTQAGSLAMRNGSWTTSGSLSVANTTIRQPLASQVILTAADTLRRYAQYNETAYARFVVADAAAKGVPRAATEADGKWLTLRLRANDDAASTLRFAGQANFAAAEGGRPGSATVMGAEHLEILGPGAGGRADTADLTRILASELNALKAPRLSIGARPQVSYGQGGNLLSLTENTTAIRVRSGAELRAGEVFLSTSRSGGGIVVEQGAAIDTLGQGRVPYDANDGFLIDPSQHGLLAVSNGRLDVLPAVAGQLFAPGSILIGDCPSGACQGTTRLYSEGSLFAATDQRFSLDEQVRFGTRHLGLAVGRINVGSAEALAAAKATGTLGDGLTLNQAVLDRLLRGDTQAGVPALETLSLSAADSLNFFGTTALDTYDRQTGSNRLHDLILGTPAIYGHGSASDRATLRTDSLIWNGARHLPGTPIAGGAGSGDGVLDIQVGSLAFGHGPNSQPQGSDDMARQVLGFTGVTLQASRQISANHKGSLRVHHQRGAFVDGGFQYSGGDLLVSTPLWTGAAGSVNRIVAGGQLTVLDGGTALASGRDSLGAELALSGQRLSIDGTFSLPSGKLTLEANDDLRLGDHARIDLAGRALTFNDVTRYSWGGDLALRSRDGDIRQAAGAQVDLSASNNRAGRLSAIALGERGGRVELLGQNLGAASGRYNAGGTLVPYAQGAVDIRARQLDDFAGLNQRLNRDQVFGGRAFQIRQGDLVIGNELKAHDISVSLDNGQLTVAGRIDASGEQVGSIRLAAKQGLTVTGTGQLDAHGSVLRVDSRGAIIEAPNRALIELNSGNGQLTLASGATFDLRHGTTASTGSGPGQHDGRALGTLQLTAPRQVSDIAGDIALEARGPLNILGARSIAVVGSQRYTDAPNGGIAASGRPFQFIDQAYLDAKHQRSELFINALLGNRDLLDNRLAGLNNSTYAQALHLRPGVEIATVDSATDLIVQGDLDLSGHRYASLNPAFQKTLAYGSGEVGNLVLRAGGNLEVYGSINDGFAPPEFASDEARMDGRGWLLLPGKQPFDSDLVIPRSGIELADGTRYPGGSVLNFDLPFADTTLPANTRLPSALYLAAALNLPAGTVLDAAVYDKAGNLLYTAGTLLKEAVTLAQGSRLEAGSRLPVAVAVQGGTWNKGVTLPEGGLGQRGVLPLAAGSRLPAGTEVKLAEGVDLIELRPRVNGQQGRNWALAQMLPQGTQSWSMRLVAGADLDAADNRLTRPEPDAGLLRLADQHYIAGQVKTGGGGPAPGTGMVWAPDNGAGFPAGEPVAEDQLMFCELVPDWCVPATTPKPGLVWAPDNGAGFPAGDPVTEDQLVFCELVPDWCVAAPPKKIIVWAPDNGAGFPAGDPVTEDQLVFCQLVPDWCREIDDPGQPKPEPERIVVTPTTQLFSVLRTGTGDLDLISAGDWRMDSLFGVYTAGTQAPALLVDGRDPYLIARGQQADGSLLGAPGATYEAVTAQNFRAWYPEQGGNVRIEAGGNLTGNLMVGKQEAGGVRPQQVTAGVGSWLWRQGQREAGTPAAWGINFGTYAQKPGADPVDPWLVGFTGIGTLGGGNLAVSVAGDAGLLQASDAQLSAIERSQGLNLVVASSGRVAADGQVVQTGGGDLDLRVGGGLNPGLGAVAAAKVNTDLAGTLVNLRGALGVEAASVGVIQPQYGSYNNFHDTHESRAYDPYTATRASALGGLLLAPGDSAVRLQARGDVVVQGVGDAGRVAQYNTLPFTGDDGRAYKADGFSWFSLWRADTAVDLLSAGGNLVPVVAPYESRSASVNLSLDGGRLFYPTALRAVAANGSLYYGSSAADMGIAQSSPYSLMTAPSANSELQLLAGNSIYAGGYVISQAGTDSTPLATPERPAFLGRLTNGQTKAGNLHGDLAGERGSYPLYTYGLNTYSLVAADPRAPSRFYALQGDIVGLNTGELITFSGSGLKLYQGAGPTRIMAGRDIVNAGVPLEGRRDAPGELAHSRFSNQGTVQSTGNLIIHGERNDVSLVSAGRDIRLSTFNVAGPGLLEVVAGRNLFQSGQGVGSAYQEAAINSIGRVGGGGSDGASIALIVGAGEHGPDYAGLLRRYLDPARLADPSQPLGGQPDKVAKVYEHALQGWLRERHAFEGDGEAARALFATLPAEQQRIFARQVYFAELREGGREYNDVDGPRTSSYLRGRQAIAALFPERDVAGNLIRYGGNATFHGGSGIHTDFGGDIQVLTPGGQQVFGIEGAAPPASAGVITQGSGDIQLYAQGSILLGQSRIMTTFGGSILGWSASGDINAGRGSKTTVVYTPPKRTYDLWGNVGLAPSVPSTGAGIATLNPIAEVPPGDIDLIAPLGTIDAGEAGIRVSGNVNIAALQVVNAANIQVQGDAKGMPVVASVNTGAIASASAAASSATQAAEEAGRQQQSAARARQPSVITVQVLGFGGERLVPRQDGASLNPQYNRQSPVQVLGAGALDERAKAQLTEEERGNLLL